MKKITKVLLSFAIIMSVFIAQATLAAGSLTVNDLGTQEVSNGIALGNKSPIATATTLINTAMIFLGLIAVCIILMGGFKWMTAGGGEEKITEAKKLMSAGVVGIIIILSAWGVASWVLTTAVNVTK
jgi:Type IV secretion system pilin